MKRIKKIPIPNAEHVGIYAIHNKRSGKFYIGSASNITARLEQHEVEIRLRNGINKKMKDDVQDYWEIEFIVIESIPDFTITSNELTVKENKYIKTYDSINNGYNMITSTSSNLGKIKKGVLLCARKRKRKETPEP